MIVMIEMIMIVINMSQEYENIILILMRVMMVYDWAFICSILQILLKLTVWPVKNSTIFWTVQENGRPRLKRRSAVSGQTPTKVMNLPDELYIL